MGFDIIKTYLMTAILVSYTSSFITPVKELYTELILLSIRDIYAIHGT